MHNEPNIPSENEPGEEGDKNRPTEPDKSEDNKTRGSAEGDTVGGDKFEGDKVGGDKVEGDKVARDQYNYHVQPKSDPKPAILSWLDLNHQGHLPRKYRHLLSEHLLSCSAFEVNHLGKYHSLENLICFLFRNEINNQTITKLFNLLTDIFGYEIPLDLFLEFIEFIPQIKLEYGTLRDLYRYNAPKGYYWELPEYQDPRTLLEYIFCRLAQSNLQHDNSYPLINFITSLSKVINKNNIVLGKVNDWLNKSKNILGIECKSEPQQEEGQSVYLIIRVQPHDDVYAVTAWFGPEQKKIYPKTVEDENYVSVHQIEQIIQKIYSYVDLNTNTNTDFDPENNLIIELFLPVELLDQATDHWKVKRGMSTYPMLGEEHQVITRSYDRVYSAEMYNTHYLWRKRWKIWKSAIAGNIKIKPHCFHTDQDCVMDENFTLERNVPFLVFEFAPPTQSRETLFKFLLDAGIPVILFPRKQVLEPQEMRRHLKKLYHNKLGSLPKSIYLLRSRVSIEMKLKKQKGQNYDHFGHHLTLIWDDPERIPPKEIFL